MSTKGLQLYEQIVAISSDYLGPAGQRFIDRQIQNLLRKNPSDLTIKDLDVIIDWSRIALTVITEDRGVITEFIDRIRTLKMKGRA